MRNYDILMANMNPEVLAELNVKLVTVNNKDLYYLTSSGQLFFTNQYDAAIRHEYNWLMYDSDEDATKNVNDGPSTDVDSDSSRNSKDSYTKDGSKND